MATRLTEAQVESIEAAWRVHDSAKAVSRATGFHDSTVAMFRPTWREKRPRGCNVEGTGYRSWSEESRARWDAFWREEATVPGIDYERATRPAGQNQKRDLPPSTDSLPPVGPLTLRALRILRTQKAPEGACR